MIAYAPLIVVKDSTGTSEKHAFLLPGDGKTDYLAYFRLLKELGYRGAVAVEVSGMLHRKPGYQPIATAQLCYARLAPLLRPRRPAPPAPPRKKGTQLFFGPRKQRAASPFRQRTTRYRGRGSATAPGWPASPAAAAALSGQPVWRRNWAYPHRSLPLKRIATLLGPGLLDVDANLVAVLFEEVDEVCTVDQ